MKKMREKKMNNKGFSLVELIIVVAIMAVLIAVLAPTYMRYVERSKRTADASSLDQLISALNVIASDPNVTLDNDDTYQITSGANSEEIALSADLDALTDYTSIIGGAGDATSHVLDYVEFESTDFIDANITVTLAYDTTDHQWEVTPNNVPDVD